MSRYMAFFPICPVCLEQDVYPADDAPDLWECDNVRCKGWRGENPIFPGDDSDWNDGHNEPQDTPPNVDRREAERETA